MFTDMYVIGKFMRDLGEKPKLYIWLAILWKSWRMAGAVKYVHPQLNEAVEAYEGHIQWSVDLVTGWEKTASSLIGKSQ